MIDTLTNNKITDVELPFFWDESKFSYLNDFKDDKIFIEKRIIAPKPL